MNGLSMLGKNSTPHRDPTDPPRRRANQRQGHSTSAHERPPMISIIARETGEQRVWGCDHANQCTCDSLMAEHVPGDSASLYTDAWQRSRGSHTAHATVCHGVHEWAREADGDGRREGHGHTCEGAGAARRTSLRVLRGVHQPYRHLDVATDEAMVNAQQVTPELLQRRCGGNLSAHTSYT
jgi:hypothetical protein